MDLCIKWVGGWAAHVTGHAIADPLQRTSEPRIACTLARTSKMMSPRALGDFNETVAAAISCSRASMTGLSTEVSGQILMEAATCRKTRGTDSKPRNTRSNKNGVAMAYREHLKMAKVTESDRVKCESAILVFGWRKVKLLYLCQL